MASTSCIEIKRSSVQKNIKFLQELIGESVKISAVIKGNAYGHGTEVMVPLLEEAGIDHFSVYSSAEAKIAFASKSKESTLMIMGFIFPEDLMWVIQNRIEFFVSDIRILKDAISVSSILNKEALIHLDIETGMNRTGISVKHIHKVASLIRANNDKLVLKGICSHFAGAESIANHLRIKRQFSVFKKRVTFFEKKGITAERKHIASSAATVNYPNSRLDMVRVGVMLYGYWPTKETFIHYVHRKKDKADPLKRVLYWHSQVAGIKTVPEGEFIGYGLSFQAQYEMRIMIVPVGYSNGFSRALSNNGRVIVKRQDAYVIGSVNMNMTICDITNIEGVNIGDRVTLVGREGDTEINFSSFAEMNNALNYEILARLPENIKRVVK